MSVSIPGINAPPFALTIEKIEDVYNTILEVQNELNAVYQESSSTLKKAFEFIERLPELNKEQNRTISQEPPPQRPELSSETPKESCSQKEPSSQLPESLTSSSNWMLKHQGPGSGLTELLSNSGIYVSEAELNECNLFKTTDMRKFARLLLPVVFSKEALQKCTFSGWNTLNRHAFDDHVKNTFINYVTNHARDSGWEVVSRRSLIQSCNSKIHALSKKKSLKRATPRAEGVISSYTNGTQ